MNTYQIPGFDVIDLNNLSDYYSAEIVFKEHKVQMDITFDEYTVDEQKLETIEKFVTQLEVYNDKAAEAMHDDYLTGSTVKPYIEDHKTLFNKNEPAENLTASNDNVIAKLYLKRIGFYPDNESEFAVFDYTIDERETKYLVVINFKKDGEIENIMLDS